MDGLCQGCEGVGVAGHAIVETRANSNEQVRLLQRADRRHRAVHTRHTHVERVMLRERTERHQGGNHRDAGDLGELQKLLMRLRLHHTTTDVQHRALSLRDHLCGLGDLAVVRLRIRLIPRQVQLRRPVKFHHLRLDVLRDIHKHRSRAASRGNVERCVQRRRDVLNIGHHVVVLSNRHGDAADVCLLEGIRTNQRRTNLAGDRHNWHGIQIGICQCSHQVGCTRSRGCNTNTNPAGGHGITFSRVACALLMAHQHVTQRTRARQRIVQRQHGTARKAEHNVNPKFFQTTNRSVSASHNLRSRRCGFGCGLR